MPTDDDCGPATLARTYRSEATLSSPAEDKPNLYGGTASIDYGRLPNLLGYQLRRAGAAAMAHFAANVGEESSPVRFGVLELVDVNPGLTQSTLAAALGMDRSSIVPIVDRLEQDGLVERRRRRDDRRANALSLTVSGRSLLEELRRQVAAHERDMAASLTQAEREALLSALSDLRAVLDR